MYLRFLLDWWSLYAQNWIKDKQEGENGERRNIVEFLDEIE